MRTLSMKVNPFPWSFRFFSVFSRHFFSSFCHRVSMKPKTNLRLQFHEHISTADTRRIAKSRISSFSFSPKSKCDKFEKEISSVFFLLFFPVLSFLSYFCFHLFLFCFDKIQAHRISAAFHCVLLYSAVSAVLAFHFVSCLCEIEVFAFNFWLGSHDNDEIVASKATETATTDDIRDERHALKWANKKGDWNILRLHCQTMPTLVASTDYSLPVAKFSWSPDKVKKKRNH